MADQQPTGSPVRNIALLSASQALFGAGQAMAMSVAALTAAPISPNQGLATLPVMVMTIGTALATGPAAWLIHSWGRRQGFIFGASLAIPAGLVAAFGAAIHNFWLFSAAFVLFGASAAFGNQYRFAAADSVPPPLKSRAISWVIAGGVLAAFIGPPFAILSQHWIADADFAATYLVMAVFALATIGVLFFTRLAPTVRNAADRKAGRPTAVLLRTPAIVVPMIAGAASYALMVLVMVAAPLAMVYVCGHTAVEATFAIQWHIVAMFAPSFVTGTIISRIGAHLTAAIGLVLILAAACVHLSGITVPHFVAALVLLGVGWNFGYIASTSMLSVAYTPEEAARVQGLNEMVVFGVMALASIASGVLLEFLGWEAINVLAIAVAAAAVLTIGGDQFLGARRRSAA
jgi:MFS family permease